MKYLLLLALLPNLSYAKTEAQCLKDLSKRMPAEYQGMEFAKYIMICNVKLMEGFRIYLDGGLVVDKAIRRKYPCKNENGVDCPVTALEKADRLFEYEKCVEITTALQTHLKTCVSNESETRMK